MNSNRDSLIIMAKAPEAGKVKTRLISAIGAEGAAKLYRKLLQQTLIEANQTEFSRVELCGFPASIDPSWQLLNFSIPYRIDHTNQVEGDLGAKMAEAIQRSFVQHAMRNVVVIGTDCPALTAQRLNEARKQLIHHDAVIYPTLDGGYALLGMKYFLPALFQNIRWSTNEVAEKTINRLKQENRRLLIGPCLQDIDTPEDLACFSSYLS